MRKERVMKFEYEEIDGKIIVPRMQFAAIIDAKNRSVIRSYDAMKAHELEIQDTILEMTKENYMLKEELKRLKGLDS